MFDDFEKFGKVPDAYEKPERQSYAPQASTGDVRTSDLQCVTACLRESCECSLSLCLVPVPVTGRVPVQQGLQQVGLLHAAVVPGLQVHASVCCA